MTQYVKLEPSFGGIATCNDATVSILVFIIIAILGLVALHALGKKAVEIRLPEEDKKEEK